MASKIAEGIHVTFVHIDFAFDFSANTLHVMLLLNAHVP
jgi:hypothetical protein